MRPRGRMSHIRTRLFSGICRLAARGRVKTLSVAFAAVGGHGRCEFKRFLFGEFLDVIWKDLDSWRMGPQGEFLTDESGATIVDSIVAPGAAVGARCSLREAGPLVRAVVACAR